MKTDSISCDCTVASETAPGLPPLPAMWQFRHFDDVMGRWAAWQWVKPRNAWTDTVADKVREIQDYIDAGYKYELRALVAVENFNAIEAARRADEALLAEAAEALEVNWAVVMNSGKGDQQRLNKAITKLRARLEGTS